MGYLDTCTFNYNGVPSELYNLYIGWLGGEEEIQTGLTREVIKGEVNLVRHTANQYGAKYNETIKLDFYVFHKDGEHFTQEESRSINRWLSPTTYRPLVFNDDNDTDNVYYNAVCTNITDIALNGFNGKHLEFECDSPFAYTPLKVYKLNATEGACTKKIHNASDDGNYYPEVEIICDGDYSGDIKLINETDDNRYMLFNMEKVNPYNSKKSLLIKTQFMQVLDRNRHTIVPAYMLGWTIATDPTQDVQGMDKYWFRLVEGMNTVTIEGNCQVKINCIFPRKVGTI